MAGFVADDQQPKRDLRSAFAICNPEKQLEPGDSRLVDLTAVRGGVNLIQDMAWEITSTEIGAYHRQLVTGHRGSGKSQVLTQLANELMFPTDSSSAAYFAVYFDAFEALDMGNVEFTDVLIGIAQAISKSLTTTEINLDARKLHALLGWFNETVLTQEHKVEVEALLKAELEAKAGLSLVASLLSRLTGQLKAGGASRREVREKLNRELSVFLERFNDFIDHVRERLEAAGWSSLVVIVDNLEKMAYWEDDQKVSSHVRLFVQHAGQLRAPNCHLIYTVPITLLFNANLGADYDSIQVIPMVKTNLPRTRQPWQAGRDALLDLVGRRVSVDDLFENRDLVYRLIDASGGVVRDLLRIVQFACREAGTRRLPKINDECAHRAIRELGREYEYLLREEYLDRLVRIGTTGTYTQDDLGATLLYHRLVLEYCNDEHWYDLHPAVRNASIIADKLRGEVA